MKTPLAALAVLALLTGPALGEEPPLRRVAHLPAAPFTAPGAVDLARSDQAQVVAAATPRGVVIWDLESGARKATLRPEHGAEAVVVVGSRVVAASAYPPRVWSWDLAQDKLVAEVSLEPESWKPSYGLSSKGPAPASVSLRLSPQGDRVALAWRARVEVFDGALHRLFAFRRPSFAASPGMSLHVDGVDRTDSFYDLASVFWSADGRRVQGFLCTRMGAGGYEWGLGLGARPTRDLTSRAHPASRGKAWIDDEARLADGSSVDVRIVGMPEAGWSRALVRRDGRGAEVWRQTMKWPHSGRDRVEVAGKRVILAGGNEPARLFSLALGTPQAADRPGELEELYAHRDRVVVWDRSERLWAWTPGSARAKHLPGPGLSGARVYARHVDASLTWAGVATNEGEVWVWEIASGRRLARFKDAAHPYALRVHQDSSGRPLCTYRHRTGEALVTRSLDGALVSRSASSSNQRLVAASRRADLWYRSGTLVDALSGARRELPHDRVSLTHAALSPEGDLCGQVGVRRSKQLLQVWIVRRDGGLKAVEVRRTPLPHRVRDLSFAPGGPRLAIADDAGLLIGSALRGPLQRVKVSDPQRLAWLGDGRLVVGHASGALSVWE